MVMHESALKKSTSH